jgi:nuclear pore complex protein Nup133
MEKGYREKLLKAMRWEDSELRKHIEKHRLEEWTKEARRLAEQAVDQQYDDATETQATASFAKTLLTRKTRGKSAEVTNGRNGTH